MTELFAFARPWALWMLTLIPPWALWRWIQKRRRELVFAPLQYAPPEVAARLESPGLPVLASLLEGLLLAALLVGLAGPYRETRLDLIEDEGVDVLLAVDVSLSMLAEDIAPSRLEALRRIARDFIARDSGNRIGIVVFAADAYVQTPLTTDHRSLLELLEDVTVYTLDQNLSGGTAIGDALLIAAERLAASRVEGRDQSLILITDGESNQGIDPELAARWVADRDIRLYAIGVGGTEPVRVTFEDRPVGGDSPYLAALDDARLQAMTDAAGGRYWRATDAGSLEEIFAELSQLDRAPFEHRTVVARHSYSPLLAFAALVFFAGHLTLGGTILRRPYK
jgi:Ca-activated chloride channel family protein